MSCSTASLCVLLILRWWITNSSIELDFILCLGWRFCQERARRASWSKKSMNTSSRKPLLYVDLKIIWIMLCRKRRKSWRLLVTMLAWVCFRTIPSWVSRLARVIEIIESFVVDVFVLFKNWVVTDCDHTNDMTICCINSVKYQMILYEVYSLI